jgi:hypothetical protein
MLFINDLWIGFNSSTKRTFEKEATGKIALKTIQTLTIEKVDKDLYANEEIRLFYKNLLAKLESKHWVRRSFTA